MTIGAQVKEEDNTVASDTDKIKIYSSYSCDINKMIFISGIRYYDFLPDLIKKINDIIKEL